MAQFKWTGPEGWYVGDAGGQGTHMSRLVDAYECSEYGGHVRKWLANGWIELINDGR